MLTLLLSMACSDSKTVIDYIHLDVVPFELPDVNPNSDTFEQLISSHQYIDSSPEMVSAWYFGHST
jgi:hypothetical protein